MINSYKEKKKDKHIRTWERCSLPFTKSNAWKLNPTPLRNSQISFGLKKDLNLIFERDSKDKVKAWIPQDKSMEQSEGGDGALSNLTQWVASLPRGSMMILKSFPT